MIKDISGQALCLRLAPKQCSGTMQDKAQTIPLVPSPSPNGRVGLNSLTDKQVLTNHSGCTARSTEYFFEGAHLRAYSLLCAPESRPWRSGDHMRLLTIKLVSAACEPSALSLCYLSTSAWSTVAAGSYDTDYWLSLARTAFLRHRCICDLAQALLGARTTT